MPKLYVHFRLARGRFGFIPAWHNLEPMRLIRKLGGEARKVHAACSLLLKELYYIY